ncbi:hypothetical protein [Chryseolinea lacunae]|uniref:Uncharacterized protein n=1 Tax=Chryseolinea lacunae TaxID=2801331 RepID=A0ABS1KNU2_9BACT|nr:hypothetical protein [Chryseolinea lacunae]MBL0740993.1 hypothetical protein [Chryseolinea lacunae]
MFIETNSGFYEPACVSIEFHLPTDDSMLLPLGRKTFTGDRKNFAAGNKSFPPASHFFLPAKIFSLPQPENISRASARISIFIVSASLKKINPAYEPGVASYENCGASIETEKMLHEP